MSNMNKNKVSITTFAGIALMLIAIISGVYAVPEQTPYIKVYLLNQEPDPAKAGDIMTLRFKLENSGGGSLKDVNVEIVPEYPFTLRSGDSAQKSLGTVTGFQENEKVYNFDYKVQVDTNANEGEYEIKLRYKVADNSWLEEKFTVEVKTSDAYVAITKISTNPSKLIPGVKGTLKIDVKNYDDAGLRDVTLNLDFVSDSLPIAPIGTASEQRFPYLNKGEATTFEYVVMPYANADSKIYKIPAKLSYYDKEGAKYNKSDIITLIVGTEPELQITLDKSDVYAVNKAGEVTIRISNKGLSDSKFLSVKILDSESVKIIGPNTKYIGSVESDDFEAVKFTIFVKKNGKAILPLQLEYKDSNNDPYTKRVDLEIPLYTQEELKKFGIVKTSMTPIIFLIVILAGVGYWLWKRRKAKKAKQQ